MILVHSVSVGTPCNGAPVAKCGVRLQRRIRKQEPRSGIEGKDGVMSRRCSHTHQRLCLEALAVQEQPLPCLAFAVGPAPGGPRHALGHTLDDLWKPGVRVHLHLLTSGYVVEEANG